MREDGQAQPLTAVAEGLEKDQRGSFLELSWGGRDPLVLQSGREVSFLEDEHRVQIRGTAPGPDGSLIDFGEVRGRIIPAA